MILDLLGQLRIIVLNNGQNALVMTGVLLYGLITLFSSAPTDGNNTSEWLANFNQNMSTEMLGAFFIAIFFWAPTRRLLMNDLRIQIRSRDNGTAITGVERIRALRLHKRGGILKGANASRANLQEADFSGAYLKKINFIETNLQCADFRDAKLPNSNLSNADLSGAKFINADLTGSILREVKSYSTQFTGGQLQSANFVKADLHGAQFQKANLQVVNFADASLQSAHFWDAKLQKASFNRADLNSADFTDANFQGANLMYTKLQGARLEGVNLIDVSFSRAEFDENTILPNNKKWTPDTDMKMFTDPKHPHFWRSDDPASPAYRGNNGE